MNVESELSLLFPFHYHNCFKVHNFLYFLRDGNMNPISIYEGTPLQNEIIFENCTKIKSLNYHIIVR